ncbi:acetate/propionate family kinase [Humitalea sp. 24SJ18S-53]|uniref:acetate/propionate family kinase n=1 Tax=Humitalea sp. 24SJ18S-53 TaxID=3422307 RepID=UPI003D670AF6
MAALVLVLNAGSSSIKFSVLSAEAKEPLLIAKGQVEGIGAAPRFVARDAEGKTLVDRRWDGAADDPPNDHAEALAVLIDALDSRLGERKIAAIGHRVVHGGPDLAAPVVVDATVMALLEGLVPLAPLHQPHNLAGIRAATAAFPGVPQVACFDTAFHRAKAWVADTFALPPRYYDQGIRRYGFHGLSYEYIASRIAAEDPALGAGRLVVAHLGNGASLCAMANGRCVDTSMGFTALDGVPMGTRCGQIDPGVLIHLMQTEGMDSDALTHMLYHDCGLKGLSGVSQDVREIEAAGTPRAQRALAHFAFRVRREIGALAASLGGLDALVFTAGIGENARALRGQICDGLGVLGVHLDTAANLANAPEISEVGSPVRVLVRGTDEERMIARHTLALLAA